MAQKKQTFRLLPSKIFLIIIASIFSGLPAWAIDLTLGWDPNNERDLEGYAIYKKRGSAPTNKDLDGYVAVKDLSNPSYPTYTLTGLAKGTTYYLALKAYNTSGTYSAFSNALCIKVGDTIELCSDTAEGDSGGEPSGGSSNGNGGGCFIDSVGADISTNTPSIGFTAYLIAILAAVGFNRR